MNQIDDRVFTVYDRLSRNPRWKRIPEDRRKELIRALSDMWEQGFSDDQILDLFDPEMQTAEIPVVMRDAAADPQVFLEICAGIVHAAIARNLPICQETVEFEGITYSKLHLAYLVNIVDSWRYMSDEIPVLQYDWLPVLEMKRAMVQKRISGDLDLVLTWNNVDQDVLQFLGLGAYPESIPIYSSGYLSDTVTGNFPSLLTGTTFGITEEIIADRFVEFYIEVIGQLTGFGHDTYVSINDDTMYDHDGSLWAVLEPSSDDPLNFFSRMSDVRFDLPIPPSSEWLAGTPLVDATSSAFSNIPVRFTLYTGTVHYYDRLLGSKTGRISEVIEPAFLNLSQIADRIDKELLLAQIDILEDIAGDYNIPGNSILSSLTRNAYTTYFFNLLLTVYSPYMSMMAYSMPGSARTFAGMAALPNPNFASCMMFSNIVENLENFGYFEAGARDKGRARKIWIPVPFVSADPEDNYYYVNFRSTDLSYLDEMFVSRTVTGTVSDDVTGDPALYPDQTLVCYTRGNFVQGLWYELINQIEQLANVDVMSQFENLKDRSADYDKMTLCFFGDETNLINRHFIIYENSFITPGERNAARLWIYPVFPLGAESSPPDLRLERVRTVQMYYRYLGSEYVDATRTPSVEEPNNLFDINSAFASYSRRFKYSDPATLQQYVLVTMWMKCEGGGFIAAVRGIAGKVIKLAGKAAKFIAKPEVQKTIRDVVEKFGKKYDSFHKVSRSGERKVQIRPPVFHRSVGSIYTYHKPTSDSNDTEVEDEVDEDGDTKPEPKVQNGQILIDGRTFKLVNL